MIKEFFYLQKSDRKVILALLGVIIIALGIILLTGGEGEDRGDSNYRGYRSYRSYRGYRDNSSYRVVRPKAERFAFDPNTADSTQLLRLGLRPWQVRNIYKYRAAGGIYRKPQDFARLYGLTVKEYRELEPYIRISKDYQPAASLFGASESVSSPKRDTMSARHPSTGLSYPTKLKPTEHIVLNTADTISLRQVPGIGVYYARQIYRYGERLGGYVSVDQLDEIDDFPVEAKSYFIIQDPSPRKLNLNQLTLNELRRHPYINYYQAKAITDYRRLHGPIQSLEDLSLLKDFPPEVIRRLTPYVSY